MKNFLVRKTGITLIALIITVLVMLILAGVAISALTTDGSLFSKTQSAIEKYNNAVQKQDEKMASLINEMNMYYNKYSDKVNENPSELLDKIPPITATLEATNVAALTFTLKATGVDAPEISTNACSGISKYEFYIENTNGTFSLEKTIKTTDETVEYNVTKENYGETYIYKVVVYDGANNYLESEKLTVTTKNRLYLYNQGDEYTDVTGGWKNTGYNISNLGTVTKNNNNIYLYIPGNCAIYCGTTNLIDFTNYSKLYFDINTSRTVKQFQITKTAYFNNSSTTAITVASGDNFIDISSYSGEYYLHITLADWNDENAVEQNLTVNSVFLEE